MKTKQKGKLWAAICTPTDQDGKLLKNELKAHLEFLALKKVDGILVAGSTGEFHYLEEKTRKELLEFVAENRIGMELLFNISDLHPKKVKEYAKFASQFDLTGVLLLPPTYYPFQSHELAEYFVRMGENIEQPFYLYNYPERTNVSMTLEMIDSIHQRCPLAGIKQSGENIGFLISLIEWARGKDFKVYTGHDILIAELMALGVHGLIGGHVNAVPEIYAQVMLAAFNNQTEVLNELSSKLKTLAKFTSRLSFPLNIAACLEARGFSQGDFKMPMSQGTFREYQKLAADFKALVETWGLSLPESKSTIASSPAMTSSG